MIQPRLRVREGADVDVRLHLLERVRLARDDDVARPRLRRAPLDLPHGLARREELPPVADAADVEGHHAPRRHRHLERRDGGFVGFFWFLWFFFFSFARAGASRVARRISRRARAATLLAAAHLQGALHRPQALLAELGRAVFVFGEGVFSFGRVRVVFGRRR